MRERAGWAADEITARMLEGPPPPGFDCGREDQNIFLYHDAWPDQQESLSTTFLFFVQERLAAYATVLMDSLPLARRERGSIRYGRVSALKLAQLGVDRRLQGRRLGEYAVAFVIDQARIQDVKCRYVTVDARPELVAWYERQGFVRNELRQQERSREALTHGRDPAKIPVSMRFDVHTPPT